MTLIKEQLSTICGSQARIIADGVIEVNGNHRAVIKKWLEHSGF